MFFKSLFSKISRDDVAIQNILTRGVEDVFVKESLEKKLKSGRQLRVKLGFDPTGPKIHIGRAITLRKLRAFQDLGHQIVFIVGDFTARIGDPSDKLEKRPMIDAKKINENLKNYKQQIGKIMDVSKAEFHFNSSWLSKLTFEKVAELAESFSVQQMSARRNFKDRFDKGEDVSLREFLYPLIQGYDSVQVRADVELGGFDQLFNLKAGRVIQRFYKQPEQDVLTTKMLLGTDGRKMSTSWGNVINITDDPFDMFGKVMSIKDDLMPDYFLLCTNTPEGEIEEMKNRISSGENPKDAKIILASRIVEMYHGKKEAQKAEQNFINTFKKGGVPEDIKLIQVSKDRTLSDVLLESLVVSSKTEFRRLVEEGAIAKLPEGRKVSDPNSNVEEGDFKVGKRRFIRIQFK